MCHVYTDVRTQFPAPERLLPYSSKFPFNIVSTKTNKSFQTDIKTIVVPKPSGQLGQAYFGRCEAYSGIPMGAGNEQ